jgi:hypothetical protein
MAGYEPSQRGKLGYIGSESQSVDPGRGDGGQRTREDHSAHAAGETCKACGQTIEAEQTARRRGETEWAHDVCPVITD